MKVYSKLQCPKCKNIKYILNQPFYNHTLPMKMKKKIQKQICSTIMKMQWSLQ